MFGKSDAGGTGKIAANEQVQKIQFSS